MLCLREINTYYGRIQALHAVNLEVAQGEIVALLGSNGAGKTTTLMTICGLTPPRSGQILFDGEPIDGLPPEEIVARGLIQVPEGRRIFPYLSVSENLDMGAFLRRDKAGIKADREHVFSLFPILAQRRSQTGGTLSGGEQQMLALARGLMARPRILLLDEPSLGLAPLIVEQIFKVLNRINQEQGVTILLVEQNAFQALYLAHRGYILANGAVTFSGPAADLMDNPAVKEAYLGG